MRILITNDDSHSAPGIASLEKVARQLGQTIMVAPAHPLSGCSHQLTLGRHLQLDQVAEDRFTLDGTPADCVRIAIAKFGKFDWVLSGINYGANLGYDIFVSGTVAAAREATLHGMSAIALSQYCQNINGSFDWNLSESMAQSILPQLIEDPPPQNRLWNVNFPHSPTEANPATIRCDLDTNPLPADYHETEGIFRYRSDYHQRPRTAGHDVDCCFSGNISVTLI
jgi:5'-nucleotidase